MDDPYAWLEDDHGEKPLAWVAQQNRVSLGQLKGDPRFGPNYDAALAILDAPDRLATGGLNHGFVYNFWQDAANPKGLWRRTTIAGYQKPAPVWDVLLDIDALAKAEGENWVFAGAEVSPGQGKALIRLSRGGGDAVVVREYDFSARAMAADGFFLPEAKSYAAYWTDDTVLFATDFGPGSLTRSGYPRILKQWTRGKAVADAVTRYEAMVDDMMVSPLVSHGPDGDVAVAARTISFYENEYFALSEDGAEKLPLPVSADLQGWFEGAWIALLRQDHAGHAKGALVAFRGDAVEMIHQPGPRASILGVATGRDKLYVNIMDNVMGAVRAFTFQGGAWHSRDLPLPPNGSASVISTNDFGAELLLMFQNFLTPATLFFDDGGDVPRAIKAAPQRFDANGLVTEQFEAVSKDGTKIPYFITRPSKLERPAPTILYGYGGFEIPLQPGYTADYGRLWLEKGGIFVVANIRGGGEFGPAWHAAALKTNRQRAFDDFIAVADDLIARGLTTPKQLGIQGGSNGGLLVGTVMVQRPDLFGAVVCAVPLLDMIGFTHIGAGASWTGEYGDPADPVMRDYLLGYSPYHNVKPGVTYPPVFFITATSDDRVSPAHARKMAARMLEQGHQVLFYENTEGGHAAAADHHQTAERQALVFTYLAKTLGL